VTKTIDKANVASEVVARCQRLARFSEDEGSVRRTFLSAAMRDCYAEITKWLSAAGAKVSLDAAGNLRGYYPGGQSAAPRLLLGSHLDTVPNAGAYDGVLGVVLAVALLEALERRRLPFGIEVIGFSEEEGVRFGTPFIGSRALVGSLDAELLRCRDRNGVSVEKAIEEFGLRPAEIPQAVLQQNCVGYVEFHIEQGPVLENLGRPLAAVDGIVGQNRLEFAFSGRANHAGTTPMHLRRDALAGAAEWITAVESLAHSTPGLVATVGFIEAMPGATNVIAGETRATLDLRHASDSARGKALEEVTRTAESIAAKRGLSLTWRTLLAHPAVLMDRFLVDQIEQAIRKAGCEPHRMASGAGHDAMILAEKVPAAMIFLRTPGGISHDPAESVRLEDVASALDCGMRLLEQLAGSQGFLIRTRRE
jgi:allantoate deiminase